MTNILVIPDSQVCPGVAIDYLGWIGQYIVDKKPDVVVHLGDFADMESLSSYDKGKLDFEGRRFMSDVHSTRKAWDVLNKPLAKFQKQQRKNKKKLYNPEKHLTLGNHENRISRAVQEYPEFEGLMSIDMLQLDRYGWEVHDFLKLIEFGGVSFVHYVYNPMSGRPYGGMMATRLKNVGFSFVMGHQQSLDFAVRHLNNGQVIRGLVAGSCYMHKEKYLGPQADSHWNGILMLNEVEDGNYCMTEVSLDFLSRKYEGVSLKDYEPRIFA